MKPLWVYLGLVVVGFAGGLALEYRIMKPPVIVETPAVAVRQADSSLVLERAPDKNGKPTAIVPKGSTLERLVHVEVQPRAMVPASTSSDSTLVLLKTIDSTTLQRNPAAALFVPRDSSRLVLCPPVGIDLMLLREKDGSQRVVASSKDGAIVGGVDIPVVNTTAPKVLRWAVGGLYGSTASYGAYVARDVSAGQVLAGGMYSAKAHGAAFVGVGLRF